MNKIVSFLFSTRLMGVILLIFALAIGSATFIESKYGSDTARHLVYNASWFETLLFLGIINLTGNIFVSKLYRKEKLSIFLFHLAFIFILLGAGITRYFGFEGILHVRKGEFSNTVVSEKMYFQTALSSGNETNQFEKQIYVSVLSSNSFSKNFKINTKKAVLSCQGIYCAEGENVFPDSSGSPIIELVIAGENSRQNIILYEGQKISINNTSISFNIDKEKGIQFISKKDSLFVKSDSTFSSLSMATQTSTMLIADSFNMVQKMTLYKLGNIQMVVKNFYPRGGISIIKSDNPTDADHFALQMLLKIGEKEKKWFYLAEKNSKNYAQESQFEGTTFSLRFGQKEVELPFFIGLDSFILEHYPGSKSPSWYESRVLLIDSVNQIKRNERIFMNNVLSYKSYRFYQTSYDMDQKGTFLSVNDDRWGTWISYAGYFLLFACMILSLFAPKSRFRKLSASLKKTAVLIFIGILFGLKGFATEAFPNKIIDEKQAEAFGNLLVQDNGGRIKPVNSLSSELIRKISRKEFIDGQNSDQVFLGMMAFPEKWQKVPMIRIGHEEIGTILGTNESLLAFSMFFLDSAGIRKYLLESHVEAAFRKKPAERSKFDNEILRADERLNLCYLIYTGNFLRIFPSPKDVHASWYTPVNAGQGLNAKDSAIFSAVIPLYFQILRSDSADKKLGEDLISAIAKYQKQYGGTILPTDFKIKAEIFYNKLFVFDRIAPWYGLLGFLLLLLQFLILFKNKNAYRKIKIIIVGLLMICFGLHLSGLLMRWYVSGHAPWSNAYESLLYIGFATVLAGLIFAKKSGFSLAVSALLAWVILFVAHLNWMDPEITPLVPVLKSYWLLIHVAVITASYGFLSMAALMAFINLSLMWFRSAKSSEIIKELSTIIEMALIVGLYMLTIGTFLGGIWANESWGRYWAWDPKETWALVSVLVYAFVAHAKLIPGLKSIYLFNLFSVLAFSSIIMTYFGVNYYLTGLHSYAKGDPAPIPIFVYYTVSVIFIVAVGGWYRKRKNAQSINSEA